MDYYLIEFTTDVLLDGNVVTDGGDSGDPDIVILGEDDTYYSHYSGDIGSEVWTGDTLAAGRFLIELNAYFGFPTYTMTLTTTAL